MAFHNDNNTKCFTLITFGTTVYQYKQQNTALFGICTKNHEHYSTSPSIYTRTMTKRLQYKWLTNVHWTTMVYTSMGKGGCHHSAADRNWHQILYGRKWCHHALSDRKYCHRIQAKNLDVKFKNLNVNSIFPPLFTWNTLHERNWCNTLSDRKWCNYTWFDITAYLTGIDVTIPSTDINWCKSYLTW